MTVIRDAVIRLKLEQTKAKLEAPDVSKATKAYEEHSKAVKETAKATAEAAHGHEDFGRRSFASMAHAGHGAMQLARGISLMAASGEEDTKKLLESLVKIEAAVSMAKGASNLAHFAGAFGPVGAAVAGVTAAALYGLTTWEKYANGGVKAARDIGKELERMNKEFERSVQIQDRFATIQGRNDQTRRERVENTSDPQKRERARQSEMDRLDREAGQAGYDADRAASSYKRARAEAEAAAQKKYTDDKNFHRGSQTKMDADYKVYQESMKAAESVDPSDRAAALAGARRASEAQRARLNLQREARDEQLGALRDQRSRVGDGLGNSPWQDASIKFGDPRTQWQRQDAVNMQNQAFAQTARMFGAPVMTGKEINEGFGAKESELKNKFEGLINGLLNIVERADERRQRLETEIQSGQTK